MADHRLKSKIIIDQIFTEGKAAFVYPIKLVYLSIPKSQRTEVLKYGVSVSKRNFKLAVDRNRIKRQMREAIRLLIPVTSGSDEYVKVMMFIFIGKEKPDYAYIENAVKKLLKKIK